MKKVIFALFVRAGGSCWVGEKGNYDQVSFVNTNVDVTFYIISNDTRFIKEYKDKILEWS
jgi:hypothetical protein